MSSKKKKDKENKANLEEPPIRTSNVFTSVNNEDKDSSDGSNKLVPKKLRKIRRQRKRRKRKRKKPKVDGEPEGDEEEAEEYLPYHWYDQVIDHFKIKSASLGTASVLCLVMGTLVGLQLRIIRGASYDKKVISFIELLGDIYLNIIKSLSLPLTIASLITALCSMSWKLSLKISIFAYTYFLATTILALITGAGLAVAIQPGLNLLSTHNKTVEHQELWPHGLIIDAVMDSIRNLFPDNPIMMWSHHLKTDLTMPDEPDNDDNNNKNNNKNNTSTPVNNTQIVFHKWDFVLHYADGINEFGVCATAIVIGLAMIQLGKKAILVREIVIDIRNVTMELSSWIVRLSPYCLFLLRLSDMFRVVSLDSISHYLFKFTLTVMLGLMVHGLAVLPLIYYFFTKQNPFEFVASMCIPLSDSFARNSSKPTVPILLVSFEEYTAIDQRVPQLVIPLSVLININGTAIFQMITVLFLAECHGIVITAKLVISVGFYIVIVSFTGYTSQRRNRATLLLILWTSDIPTKYLPLVYPTEWFLSHFRCVVNVLGNIFGAGIVWYICKVELAAQARKRRRRRRK